MRLSPTLCALLVSSAGAAWAQVDLVDPDAKDIARERRAPATPSRPPPRAAASPDEEAPDEAPADEDRPRAERPLPAVNVEPRAAPKKPDAGVPQARAQIRPGEGMAPPRAPPLQIVALSDADLDAIWQRWVKASASADIKAEQAARAELLKTKRQIDASSMELWAMGLLRAAARAEAAGDSGAAVEMANSAVELAPGLPGAWVGLTETYFKTDPSDVGRYLGSLRLALATQLSDPRYARPMLADWGSTVVVSLMGLAIAVLAVFAVRSGRYFLHDFHFLFPKSAARWQTGTLAVILVALPVVFRVGLAPSLLALLAALTLYLSVVERAVAVALIAMLGFVPVLGKVLVESTAFSDTPAERVYQADRGGPSAERAARELKAIADEGKASFGELYALGRFELRRGRFEDAAAHYKQALTQRPDDPRAQTNLGVALFLMGDLENSRPLFESATKKEPELAEAWYDLGRLFQRRLAVKGDIVAGEVDLATAAFSEARQRDPSLDGLKDEDKVAQLTGNELVRSVPLTTSELLALAVAEAPAQRVKSQLAMMMTGDVGEVGGMLYPLVLALGLAFFGQLSRRLGTARVCNKCGRPVSQRDDPDVSAGSQMCTQCVNVFAKKNVVAASLKVRKQLEVARYHSRLERIGYGLGLVFSGMGHVFSGWPIRGAVYGFFFLLAVVGFVFRNGVVRAPWEPLPLMVRLIPTGVTFVVVYLISLRGLRKKQG